VLKINATKLLQYTPEQLWENLEGEFILVFGTDEVPTDHREVIYSSYVWAFHRRFPRTPLLKTHHIQHITKGKELGAGAHLKLINSVFWDVFDTYREDYADPRMLLDELCLMVYQITNHMYNELSVRLEAFVTSLDIIDFIEITQHPKIQAVQWEAEALADQLYGDDIDPSLKASSNALAEAKIQEVNGLIQQQINEAPELKFNPLAVAIRTGIARMGQALQCLGPRGFITDVDSYIFPKPVMAGYIHGIRSLYASMIESRSAAKSLMNTTKPLQDSEYFSRRQQLVCMNIKNLHMCDCGSQNYLLWNVRGERYEGSAKINSDLDTIAGKYYMDEETGKLKVIKKGDAHLIGKTIRMRSITAGCNHPDPNGVCSTCFGETGLALPINSNLGHSACVTMTAILGQLILSTKHFDSSSTVEGINLASQLVEKRFLTAEANGNSYYLSEKLRGKKVKLYVNVEDAKGLPDLRLVNDISQINLERTSQFGMVLISITEERGGQTYEESTSLNVHVRHRLSSLSSEMLAYLKVKGFEVTKDSGRERQGREARYEFDMSDWDYKKPVFVLPMRHFNMSNHQGEIAKMLESTAEEMEKRSKHVSATNMLTEFHDLVNRLLNVNLSVLDVIIYSSMVVDTDEPNYDLPKPGTKSGLGVLRLLLSNRSLSAMMGYQGHRYTFTDPSSFVVKNRLDHPFDVLFMPHEVLQHLSGQAPSGVKAIPPILSGKKSRQKVEAF
jgi:hypothetical protein